MSLHYVVTVSVELLPQLDEVDLASVRWLFGVGPEPGRALPDQTTGSPEPLVGPLPDDGDWPRVPGGAHAHLRWGRQQSTAGKLGWSVSARDCLLDDSFYAGGLAALEWVATISGTSGLIATAQEELEPLPSWFLFAFDERLYVLGAGGEGIVPFSGDGPPAPARAHRLVRERFTTVEDGGYRR